VRALLLVGLSASFALAALAACAGSKTGDAPDAAASLDASVAVDAAPSEEAAAPDAGRGNVTKIGATAQTSVLDQRAWPEKENPKEKGTKAEKAERAAERGAARRLGYLRHGAVVAAYDRPVVNDECQEGWYELVAIPGFVCGKAVTAELTSPKVRLAPKQPDSDAGMPYRYGVNVSDGTPLYRRVLPSEERKKFEPWLVPAKPAPEEAASETAAEKTAEKAVEKAVEKSEAADEEHAPATRRTEPADAGVDAGRPKLKELKGRGVLVRKMARGFYLALDREFRSNGARWWRTTFGFAVPFDRILLQSGVTKHAGSWFSEMPLVPAGDGDDAGPVDASVASDAGDGGEAPSLVGAVAFVSVGFARKLEVSADEKKITWGPELPKRSAVKLTGREATVSGAKYHQTTAGFWVRLMELTLAHLAPPADLGPNEKWIDVDLTRQLLVALEGTKPVFATLISSGRRNPQDKEKDFPTPTGSYRIREKHVTTTMDGDVASDGPYSIEDVPWVMYFQGSYALHGAFWHDSFGHMRSHGCVNMAPDDARTLFAWTDPPLPAGFHGVFSRDDSSGTRIVVHEDPRHRH
jgi:lipoprotein-anchoring transpeptidase ErfK/SrfK